MKKLTGYAVLFCMAAICFFLSGCKKADTEEANPVTEPSVTQKADTVQSEMVKRDENVIIWTVPDGITESEIERNVLLVNEKLAEDGYPFTLKIQTLSSKSYRQDLLPLLENGATDIASLGMDFADGSAGFGQDLIRAGYFEELSSYLDSEAGKKLKMAYCEQEWKIVETDGGIYSLPNQYGMKGGEYLAFNKEYVTEEMLTGFSGSITELETLLDGLELPEDVYPVMGHFSVSVLTAMCNADLSDGVLINLATGKVENPYQNVEFCQCLRLLNRLCRKNYLNIYKSEKQTEVVTSGKFAVWIGWEYDELYDSMKDKVITVPLPFIMPNALSCTSGISQNSFNKDAALQLLTLLYTEETYANLLVFGKEGEDYQLLDGYVQDMQGNSFRKSKENLMLGIYDPLYPCHGDDMTINRREMKNSRYNSAYCLNSVVLGFKTDYSSFDESMYQVSRVTEQYLTIWTKEDFESQLAVAQQAFEEADGNRVIEELDRQISGWMRE